MNINSVILFYLKNYFNIPNRSTFLNMIIKLKESSDLKKQKMRTGLIKFSYKQELMFNIPISSDFKMEYKFQDNNESANSPTSTRLSNKANTKLTKILLYVFYFLAVLLTIHTVFNFFFNLCFANILSNNQYFYIYKYIFGNILPSTPDRKSVV